jgi:hypothetical protein
MAGMPPDHSSVSLEMHPVHATSRPIMNSSNDSVELIFRELGYCVDVEKTSTERGLLSSLHAAKRETKEILKRVTGIIRPHRLTCILGASGAGKTSLLNILSGSLVSGTLSGQLVSASCMLQTVTQLIHASCRNDCSNSHSYCFKQLMNGNPVGGDFIGNMSGYVHQVAR